MSKLTFVSIVGVTLLLAAVLGCATLGLAVRTGMIREQLLRYPPNTRYQLIVRVGNDALPWDLRRDRPHAINVWVHGRGTAWHIVNLLRVPLGSPPPQPQT
ncbi:MAG TPA: hypothetical protein PLO33_08950 [Kouleothrix sp.]|uniref:hypothetical protein n=1 Tax=Kouleothrix sp. TaxID=2779161 RepID=UPI002B9E2901|nr:hypothetical protein [Kouleothrix sp.]HRC75795.1 hypothetical protein [Kouleothrix sp.]